MGARILREVAKPITADAISSQETQKIIDDLTETARSTPDNGFITAGIAAPQVGESVRIFLAMKEGVDRKNPEYNVFINPELDFPTPELVESEESCLSTPGLKGVVMRYKDVKVKYFDRTGTKQKIKLTGDQAVFVQHEYDHLDGVLWIDKVVSTRTIVYC